MRIFDLHADIGTDILETKMAQKVDNVLMSKHYDKLQQGEVACSALACYFTGNEDWDTMQKMVLATEEDVKNSPVHCILSKEDLEMMDDKQNVIITVEGMCGIKEDPEEKIQWLYDHGVRIASLCWNDQNALASGKNGSSLNGLTELGKRAILKMNELNMIIDVSHANEKTFWDILALSSKPVIATHSNMRKLANVDRNLSDQQFLALAEKGGLSGLNAARNFIDANTENQDSDHLAMHAVRMKELAGIEHIAIGFDFMDFLGDYDNSMAKDLNSAKEAQNMVNALKKFFTEEEVEKITWSNAVEFLKKWL